MWRLLLLSAGVEGGTTDVVKALPAGAWFGADSWR